MARTYNYADLGNVISRNSMRTVEDDLQAIVSNMATNLIWNAYDWRESLVALPPFYLVPDEQDHGAPFVAVPSDFQGLRVAYFTQVTSTPPLRRDLSVKHDLALTHQRYISHAISYEPTTSSFRVFPRVPDNVGAADYLVDGEYKKRPTKITPQNLANTTLPFDDIYFNVWIDAAQWAAWHLAKDQRAGQVQFVRGRKPVYSGQLGQAMSMIDWMASNEGLELGDPIIAPSEPLAGGTWGQYGFPGWGVIG